MALTGCSTLAVQDKHADVKTRLWRVASRMEMDRRQGGMAQAIADITQCYEDATVPLVKVYALRDCMVLDYAGYRLDMTIDRRLNGGPLPYYEDKVFADRVTKYGKMDGFATGEQLVPYLQDADVPVRQDTALLNAGPVVAHDTKDHINLKSRLAGEMHRATAHLLGPGERKSRGRCGTIL